MATTNERLRVGAWVTLNASVHGWTTVRAGRVSEVDFAGFRLEGVDAWFSPRELERVEVEGRDLAHTGPLADECEACGCSDD